MAVTVKTDTTFRFDPPEFLFESPYRILDQPPSYDVAPDGRFLMIKPNEGEPRALQIGRPKLVRRAETPRAERLTVIGRRLPATDSIFAVIVNGSRDEMGV